MAVANTGQSISWYKHLRFPHRFLDIEELVIEADSHRINMGCIKNPRVLSVLSGVIGALTGAFISLVVDSSLFEISVTLYDPHNAPHTRWFIGLELFMVTMLMNEVGRPL